MNNAADMQNRNYCQSCSMPLDNPEMLGSEKDGSKSHEYCKYCFQKGAFVNPDMSLEEMKALVKEKMMEMNIDPGVIALSVGVLPQLRRWTKAPVL